MRGIQIPLNAAYEQIIMARIADKPVDTDVSFLRSPEDYLNHVYDKEYLRSTGFPGVGCPADGPLIIETLHALLDKPQITPEESRAELGLTEEEINCLKLFGQATNTAALEEKIWRALEEFILEKGSGSPLVVSRRDKMRQDVLRRLNLAQRQANEGLGREAPTDGMTLTIANFNL